jgi:thioredoxin-related protein
MRRICVLIAGMVFILHVAFGQEPGAEKVSIYNPQADAKADINTAIAKAARENKHVLVQIGGNWCPWCIKFHRVFNSDQKVDSIVKADYVFVLVNFSRENKNLPIMQELEYPQRFGFPVLVVLDATGKRIHTQDTGLLESGDGYDPRKVVIFLKEWNMAALDPKRY